MQIIFVTVVNLDRNMYSPNISVSQVESMVQELARSHLLFTVFSHPQNKKLK